MHGGLGTCCAWCSFFVLLAPLLSIHSHGNRSPFLVLEPASWPCVRIHPMPCILVRFPVGVFQPLRCEKWAAQAEGSESSAILISTATFPILSRDPSFQEAIKKTQGNIWFLKRTMVEKNGESTPEFWRGSASSRGVVKAWPPRLLLIRLAFLCCAKAATGEVHALPKTAILP